MVIIENYIATSPWMQVLPVLPGFVFNFVVFFFSNIWNLYRILLEESGKESSERLAAVETYHTMLEGAKEVKARKVQVGEKVCIKCTLA